MLLCYFRFLSLKNINIFLSACKASFGLVKESDLFDPTMLYDFTGRLTISITLFDKFKKCRSSGAHFCSGQGVASNQIFGRHYR